MSLISPLYHLEVPLGYTERAMRFLVFLLCICVSVAAADSTAGSAPAPAPADVVVPGNQAKFDKAAANFDAGNYEAAFKGFSKLAKHGDLAAMRNVALMQRKGLGTDKDPEAALSLYRYVAAAGLPTAQYDLAMMLLHGEAGDPDPKHAAQWFAAAAEANHPLAQYELGKLFEDGNGVDKNLASARKLYEKAAARGVMDAKVRLAVLKGEKPPKLEAQPGLQPSVPVTREP